MLACVEVQKSAVAMTGPWELPVGHQFHFCIVDQIWCKVKELLEGVIQI
jgi:hypothetical protein